MRGERRQHRRRGARMLATLGDRTGWRTLDVGCGCLGWVRLLSHWVGPNGTCVGSDVDDRLLEAATVVVDTDALANVKLVRDDLFDSRLAPGSFDLVHARFQLAPLGRFSEQIDSYARLLRPGGTLVLEDPDTSSWRFEPPATATGQLISLIIDAFQQSGGDFNAGRRGYDLFVDRGWQPRLRADIVAYLPATPTSGSRCSSQRRFVRSSSSYWTKQHSTTASPQLASSCRTPAGGV